MRPRIQLIVALAVAACALPAGAALAGTGDATVVESLGTHLERTSLRSVMARPDGSLLALQGEQLRSFNADGSADSAFAPPPGPGEGRLFPAAGGKTFLLGYQQLTRLNPDGSIDTSFGHGGSIDPGYGAGAVFELGSGKILLVSTETNGPKVFASTVRVSTLDQNASAPARESFSASISPTGIGYGATVAVPEISSTGDGGALVIGGDFLLRVDAEGSVDRGFGDGGVVQKASRLVGGHVLPGGSIEVVGTGAEGSGTSEDFALTRFTSTGEPETAFGPEGTRPFDLGEGTQDEARVASWGADGSVVVGGSSSGKAIGACVETECGEVPVLAAFDAAGNPDAGFATGGVLRLTSLAGLKQGFASEGVTALARRPDGSIVAAGVAPPNETTGFLAAVSPAGVLLPGFGDGGIAREPEPLRARQTVAGFVVMPDGGLLAGGTTNVGVRDQPALFRYRPDDTLDRSFGGGSGWKSLFEAPDGSPHGAEGFAVSGEDVLVGHYDTPDSHLFMAHASDGSPVATFGQDGTVDLPPGTYGMRLAFAGNGDPLVLATSETVRPASEVLRYRPDGSLVTDFGKEGRYLTRLGHTLVRGKSILTEPGERILVGGSFSGRFAVTSLLPGGHPDPHFGKGGWLVLGLGEQTHYMTLGNIGKWTYLAGSVGDENDYRDVVLARFDRHGHLDRRFGHSGIRSVRIKNLGQPVEILPTPQGPLVVLGGGYRPLITFGKGSKASQSGVGNEGKAVGDVQAALAGDGLVVGWSTYEERSTVYHFTRLPL